jgi:hypothetical protein
MFFRAEKHRNSEPGHPWIPQGVWPAAKITLPSHSLSCPSQVLPSPPFPLHSLSPKQGPNPERYGCERWVWLEVGNASSLLVRNDQQGNWACDTWGTGSIDFLKILPRALSISNLCHLALQQVIWAHFRLRDLKISRASNPSPNTFWENVSPAETPKLQPHDTKEPKRGNCTGLDWGRRWERESVLYHLLSSWALSSKWWGRKVCEVGGTSLGSRKEKKKHKKKMKT